MASGLAWRRRSRLWTLPSQRWKSGRGVLVGVLFKADSTIFEVEKGPIIGNPLLPYQSK